MLSIITVTYNSTYYVINLLKSIQNDFENLPTSFEIIIVDNNSSDNTIELIEKFIQQNSDLSIKLIKSPDNLGFGKGNNLAIQNVSPKSKNILLLNPDIEVKAFAIKNLLDAANDSKESIVLVPQLYYPNMQAHTNTYRFPSMLNQFLSHINFGFLDSIFNKQLLSIPPQLNNHQFDWCSGAAFLIRTQAFKKHCFDPEFFLYFEELDLFKRFFEEKFKLEFVPKSKMIHTKGHSTGVSNLKVKRKPYYWFFSRRYYFIKNHNYLYFVIVTLISTLASFVYRLHRKIRFKSHNLPDYYEWDLLKSTLKVPKP